MKYERFDEVIQAYPWEIGQYLDTIATHKGHMSWLIVPPNSKNKVCLVSHIDTVFEDRLTDYPKEIVKEKKVETDVPEGSEPVTLNIWSSPNGICGDDRCGVYAMLKLYNTLPDESKPYLLFTDGEESGGRGAHEACKLFEKELTDVTFFVELDRQGFDDMVFYNNEPDEFVNYIGAYGFRKAQGSFSDISILGPAFKKCAVNLSVGYYNQHTLKEVIICEDLVETMNKVYKMCMEETGKTKVWEHEKKYVIEEGYARNIGYSTHNQEIQTLAGFSWDY